MRIALISPPVWTIETPPLNIAYLKAYLKSNGYSVKCFDVNTELFHKVNTENKVYWKQNYYRMWQDNKLYKKMVFPKIVKANIDFFVDKILSFKPDIVGISVYSACFTKTIIRKIKEKDPNILIVLGGQTCVDQLQGSHLKKSKDIDIIVKGEGEITLKKVIDIFAKEGKVEYCKGCLIRKGRSFVNCGEDERIKDMDGLPYPDFDDFDLNIYFHDFESQQPSNALPILLSRGCNNRCDFCLQRVVWKNKLYVRKAENVFDEMVHNKKKYGVSKFVFADLLINENLKELEKLCDLIIENNFSCSWWGGAKIDKKMDINLFKKMRKAGCHHLALGIESASDNVLKAMCKPYTSNDTKNFLKMMKEAGITVGSNIIIGHPSESRDDFIKTLNFLWEMRDIITTQPWPSSCTIFRNTDIYNKYIPNKNFRYKHASSWSYRDNTDEERESRIKIYKSFCLALYNKFDMIDHKEVKYPPTK